MTAPRTYEGDDRRAPTRWRINKEISIMDLVTVAIAVSSIMYSYNKLDSRTEMLEKLGTIQSATDARQDADNQRQQARLEAQLAEVNRKLDASAIELNHKMDRLLERKP